MGQLSMKYKSLFHCNVSSHKLEIVEKCKENLFSIDIENRYCSHFYGKSKCLVGYWLIS